MVIRLLAFSLVLAAVVRAQDVAPVTSTERLLAERSRYPAVWWAPLAEAERHSWEVPPQDAGPGEVILSKRNELGILSNFAATPFELHGRRFASLEGFWQAMKYPEGADDPRAVKVDPAGAPVVWPRTRADVEGLAAFAAHSAGVEAEALLRRLGIDWVSYRGERLRFKTAPTDIDRHFALIVEASWAKLRQNPEVKRVLLSTGDLVLRADHHEDADGTKAWRYYEIWMGIRASLQAGRE
jgi:predicted NAD-dependent protein-ADP-ribosyltransferase YbiA (DUF1768 family)